MLNVAPSPRSKHPRTHTDVVFTPSSRGALSSSGIGAATQSP